MLDPLQLWEHHLDGRKVRAVTQTAIRLEEWNEAAKTWSLVDTIGRDDDPELHAFLGALIAKIRELEAGQQRAKR